MLAIERRNEILEKLQTDRRVVVSELSQMKCQKRRFEEIWISL